MPGAGVISLSEGVDLNSGKAIVRWCPSLTVSLGQVVFPVTLVSASDV